MSTPSKENVSPIAQSLLSAARELAAAVDRLKFAAPVSHVYNPLVYAWTPHAAYLRRYGANRKRVVFIGMNPGPFGMAQCGVPFGEIEAVRDWMKISGDDARVDRPAHENPKRPIEGFACTRSEVSGRRLWGLFRERFGSADAFFAEHFVANYCPLAFFDQGRNLTPDKLPVDEAKPLYEACDAHLRSVVSALQPEWIIGIGGFAEVRASTALAGMNLRIGRVLHPSPASPAANRGWSQAATQQLLTQGVWTA